jgi:hypothetical protein
LTRWNKVKHVLFFPPRLAFGGKERHGGEAERQASPFPGLEMNMSTFFVFSRQKFATHCEMARVQKVGSYHVAKSFKHSRIFFFAKFEIF